MKFFQKIDVFMHFDFYHFQYFGLILVKMKAFQKIFSSIFLKLKALQILKFSSKSVTTSV